VQVILLYAVIVLIWGSTWSAIPYQLGVVAEEVSVGYRFGLAAITLYAYALLSRRQIRLPINTYPIVALQGTLLFCLAYFFVYYGAGRLTSGLVAVLFSSIVLTNATFERIFFRTPFDRRIVVAALLGITGIAMIFWPEVAAVSLDDDALVGMLLVFIGVMFASLGNMTAIINTRRALPIIAVNTHSMAWAAVLSLVIAYTLDRKFLFPLQPGFILSLGYLAVFGSAIAFGCYLALIRHIGSARAAYTSVLYPVVALGISTVVEDYRWTVIAAAGIMLTLAGNWLVLRRSGDNTGKQKDTHS